MELSIDLEVYKKFCEVKAKLSNPSFSDSQFLAMLLSHMESCGSPLNALDSEHVGNSGGGGGAPLICPECRFSASSIDSLHKHFDTAHTDTGSFSCTCGDSYARLADFLLHYTDCPVAATDLQEPCLRSHGKRVKRSPSASKCEQQGTGKEQEEEEEASECPPASPETYQSYRHPSVSPVAGPSDDKPFGCPKCFKGFKSKSLLEQHMHLHYPPRYKCRWCGNVYRWPPVYYHHKQKCKNRPVPPSSTVDPMECDEKPQPATILEEPPASNESFIQAQKALAQFLNFRTPLIPAALDEANARSSPATNGACPMTCICAEVFPNFQSYFKHSVNCPSILSATSLLENLIPRPLGLASSNSLSNNADFREPDDSMAEDLSSTKEEIPSRPPGYNGIFSCSICDKAFNSKLSLKQHVDGKHRAEGKYLCRACGKRYRWGASFYYHRRTCVASEATDAVGNQPPELLTSNT